MPPGENELLDLWSGGLQSRFTLDGAPVSVQTACHPEQDVIAVRVASPLVATGQAGTVHRLSPRNRGVRRAAQNVGATAVTFYAPLVVPGAATATTLRRQPGIADALHCCAHLSVAVIAVGMWAPGDSTVYDALPAQQRAVFAKRGAVAESSGLLIAADGQPLRDGLQKRAIAVTEAQLRRADDVVALAIEPHRTPAIRALTRSGIVRALITHRAVAERLLAEQPAKGQAAARRASSPRTH
jgi:DNA-binding transcriptional regulator LsrR (DeoR family)